MEDFKTTTHTADIAIDKDILNLWEAFLLCKDIDYDAEKWGQNTCVWCQTAKFDDGMEMDVKVCTNSKEDKDCWSEAVLFTPDGSQVDCTEVCDSLRGEWRIENFDRAAREKHVYIATVKDYHRK